MSPASAPWRRSGRWCCTTRCCCRRRGSRPITAATPSSSARRSSSRGGRACWRARPSCSICRRRATCRTCRGSPGCRRVARGSGPRVARLGLDRLGILVTTARGVHAGPLAEWVFMALLTHLRGYDRLRDEQAATALAAVCRRGPGRAYARADRCGRSWPEAAPRWPRRSTCG